MIYRSISRSFVSVAVIFAMLIGVFGFSNVFAANERKNINNLSINLAYTEFDIDGKTHCPKVIIKDGSYTLKKGTDYTTKYKISKKANVNGEYDNVVYIEGIGNYFGEAEKHYIGKDPSNNGSSSSGKKTQYIQGGKDINSGQVYDICGGLSFKAETDITGKSSDTKNTKLIKKGNTFKFIAKKAGKYTLTFTAKANDEYKSAKRVIVYDIANNDYDKKHVGLEATPKSKGFSYHFKLNSKASKYKFYYKESSASSWKTKEISKESADKNYTNGNHTSPEFSVSGLKSNTSYQIKIKPYVNGKWVDTEYWSEKYNKFRTYKVVTTKK